MSNVTSAGFASFQDSSTSLAGTNATTLNIPVGSDPRAAGLAAGIGSTAYSTDGSNNVTAWYKKLGTGDKDWEKQGVGSLISSGHFFYSYMQKAKTVLGTDNISVQYTDFGDETNCSVEKLLIGPGLVIGQYNCSQGWAYHVNGGASNGIMRFAYNQTARAYVTGNPKNRHWYVAGRVIIYPVAPGWPIQANSQAGVGIITDSNTVCWVGVNGAASNGAGAQWVGTIGATTVLGGVAIDPLVYQRQLQMWNNASGTWIQTDTGSPVQIASTNLPTIPVTACIFSSFTSDPVVAGVQILFEDLFSAAPQYYTQV